MTGIQRDQDVRVRGPGWGGVAIREIDAAVGQANVVDDAGNFTRRNLFPDEAFDPVTKICRLFNPSAGPPAHVQLELSGVDHWKEIPSQPGHKKHERAGAYDYEAPQEHGPVVEAPFQHLVVAIAKFFEPQLKGNLHPHQGIPAGGVQVAGFLLVAAQQILGHGRDQGPGQQIGRKHGEDHGLGQRDKQISGHAGKEEHGQKHNTNGERRNKGRDSDLLRTIQNRLLNFFAFRDVPVDVFDFDGGVVHQNADRERQSAQGHDVDSLAQRAQDDDGSKNRKWDGNRDDDRAAPAPQKNQDHDSGETGRNQAFLHHSVDGGAHE